MKGLLGNLEGAVLKQAGTGQAAGMWRILLQVSNKFVQVCACENGRVGNLGCTELALMWNLVMFQMTCVQMNGGV